MRQYGRKVVCLTWSAEEDFLKLPPLVRTKFSEILRELEEFGVISYPNGRKLQGYDLYEMRVKHEGIYRGIYCFWSGKIMVLSFFKKKTQKTPLREIQKALRRKNNL